MPRNKNRNRRRNRKRSSERETPQLLGPTQSATPRRSLDVLKARYWQRRLKAADKAKEEFTENGREVDDYVRSRHASLFSSPSVRDYFMQFDGAAAVSVPKSAQVRNNLGPHLYLENPKRNVNPKTSDLVMLAMARALEAYINRTPREARLKRECRRTIDDSLLRGRGFMKTGWDQTLEVITSWYVSSGDVFIDPDVTTFEDAEWIAIRRVVPLFRAEREVKEKWRKRNLKANYRSETSDSKGETSSGDLDMEGTDENDAPLTNDLVELFDVYSKMGPGIRGHDFPEKPGRRDDVDFVKLTVCMDHDVPLFEGDWEIPLYLDRDWPLVAIDFVETLDVLWPESVMSQVMPLQKAMDLLTSLELNSCKMRAKVVVVGDSSLDVKVQQRIKNGTPSEYLAIDLKQGERLQDKFMTLDFGRNPTEVAQARDFLERQFEATTGLTELVTGGQSPGAADRSATATRARSAATNARLGDMRSRVEEWATAVARHEALAVRIELEVEEVEPYVSPEDIGLFLVSIRPPREWVREFGVEEIPIRDRRNAAAKKKGDAMTMEFLSQAAATYFPSPEEAADAMMTALADIAALAEVDFRVAELARIWAAELGMPYFDPDGLIVPDEMGQPKLNLPKGVTLRPVTVTDCWRDTAGITEKTLMRELSYEIATGSMGKYDKDREIEVAETAMQQVMPLAVQAGDYNLINAIFHLVNEAHEIPEDKRLPQLQPPPPPPEAQPQGQPQ